MRLIPLALLSAVLAGCVMVPLPPGPPIPMPVPDACGAASLQNLVGLSVRVLPPRGPWQALRIIRPGQMVTMDYSATRLNVRVDEAGTMLELTCG